MHIPTDTRDPIATSPAPGTGTSSPAVRLEAVEKRNGDIVAVAGIDLDVRDGEFFSMLGPSGSSRPAA